MGFIVIQWDFIVIYPLVMTNSLLLNMTIEIVDLPKMVDLSIVVLVYQRVISEIMNIHEHPSWIHESRQVSQSLYPGYKKK